MVRYAERNITCEQERASYDEVDGKLPHGKHARRRLPHFIIIGVKKCGTRALLNFLNIHPDVVVSSQEVSNHASYIFPQQVELLSPL